MPILTISCPSSLVELVSVVVLNENFHVLVICALLKPRTQRRDHVRDVPANIYASKEQRLQAPYCKGAAFFGVHVSDDKEKGITTGVEYRL